MGLYIDLLITNNDLTLDPGGEPLLTDDRDSIAQDIRHLIRESGLMVRLVGNRNGLEVADLMLNLTVLVEDDERLVPGTIEIAGVDLETYFVRADTTEFGPLSLGVAL